MSDPNHVVMWKVVLIFGSTLSISNPSTNQPSSDFYHSQVPVYHTPEFSLVSCVRIDSFDNWLCDLLRQHLKLRGPLNLVVLIHSISRCHVFVSKLFSKNHKMPVEFMKKTKAPKKELQGWKKKERHGLDKSMHFSKLVFLYEAKNYHSLR